MNIGKNSKVVIAYGIKADNFSMSSETVPQTGKKSLAPYNLPQRTNFAGRKEVLKQIDDSLKRSRKASVLRQCVIQGTPGIGKTAVAVEYAWRHRNFFSGGIFFLDMSKGNISDALVELGPTVIGQKSIPFLDSHEVRKTVADRVKIRIGRIDKPYLIIVDDLKSVAQWNDIKKTGLIPTPKSHFLITTTNFAYWGGDKDTVSLDGLHFGEAIELLSAFRLDSRLEDNLKYVHETIRCLGGNPRFLTVVGVYLAMKINVSWRSFVADLTKSAIDTITDAEKCVRDSPDGYTVKIDLILNKIFDSLDESHMRILSIFSLMFSEDRNYRIEKLKFLLANAFSVELPTLPGYSDDPLQRVVDEMITMKIVRRFDEHGRILMMDEILREKMDRIFSAQENIRDSLLEQMYKNRFSTLALRSEIVPRSEFTYIHDIYVVLEKFGKIDNSLGLYNDHVELYHLLKKAEIIVAETNGDVVFRFQPRVVDGSIVSINRELFVAVVVPDLMEAQEVASKYSGRVDNAVDGSGHRRIIVHIPVNL